MVTMGLMMVAAIGAATAKADEAGVEAMLEAIPEIAAPQDEASAEEKKRRRPRLSILTRTWRRPR